ncbi:MAG: DUF262 domain-containing HNH endonuclease family protein [Muribaculum sp.]|nr:DUF262 domain-containing HNH endonuclease family protein [Muribaculum sp.]
MDAGKRKINDILNGNRQLVIPFFQRSYVWKEDLWERFLESMEQVSREGKEYFLGSIILKQQSTTASSSIGDVRTVIDGQQRLTTLALFLKVLCFKTSKIRKFENMLILDDNKYAICHNMFDKDVFEEIVIQKELKALEEKDNGISKAYKFFLERVDPQKLNLETILAHISFVGIDLNNEDDEQVIFDTINSIGVTLTTGELLKNYLFTQESYDKYLAKWKPIFEADEETLSYWDAPTTQGRLIRKNLETFLYAYLHIKIHAPEFNLTSAQKERFRTANDLFSQYKDFISLTGINKDVLVEDLTSYAKLYRQYLTPKVLDEEIPSEYGIERINLIVFGLDTTTLMPYLLYLLKNQSDKSEIKRIARVLESYLMRRLVCKSSNNNYSDLFSTNLISSQFLNADSVIDYLLSKESDSSLAMPGDEALVYAFEENTLPNVRAKGVLYLLESMIREPRHLTVLRSYNKYSLEHLMPVKWKPETWPISDLSKSEERNQKLKTLGNLALLTQSLNASISNNSWNVKLNGNTKKKGLLEYASGLVTMKWPLEQDEWNEDKIALRADWLFSHARVIWNFEDVEFQNWSTEIQESADAIVSEPEPEMTSSETEKKKINSNNDRSKYSLDGGANFLSKNRFVQAAVRKYVELHPEITLDQLKAVFKDSFLRGFKRLGFICSEADLTKVLPKGRKPTEKEIARWYYMERDEWLTSGDGIPFTVSTQMTLDSTNDVKAIIESEGIDVQISD